MIEASVLVVGGGAIGGITAAKLAGEVRRVVVLDSDEQQVERLREPGLTFEEAGAEHTVALDAVGSADELDGEFDFALIAVKSPFHRAALEPLAAARNVEAFVSLGNGLIQDRMAELVGADRLLSCIVEWGGTNLGPGRVVRDTIAPMVVGELDGSERERTRLLARCLEPVGDVRVTRNLRGQIWSKLLVNSAFTGLSAVSGLRYGGVAEHPDGRTAAYAIWAEGSRSQRPRGWRSRRCSTSSRASWSTATTPRWRGSWRSPATPSRRCCRTSSRGAPPRSTWSTAASRSAAGRTRSPRRSTTAWSSSCTPWSAASAPPRPRS